MNPTTSEKPDYQLAAEELQALFNAQNLTTEVYGLRADVTDGDKPWVHVACVVSFLRAGKFVGSLDWKMGIGLIDWKKVRFPLGSDLLAARDAMIRLANLTPETQRKLAAAALPHFKARVNPAEVLATACWDGEDARGQSFEEWAENLGYDTDSRKAETIYLACQTAGTVARRILGTAALVSQFAGLAGRL
jgi:hypothetical protein